MNAQVGMPLTDFMAAYAQEPFEIIGGQVSPRLPTNTRYAEAIKRLYSPLFTYEVTHRYVFTYWHSPFVVSPDAAWVQAAYVPDVMVYQVRRMKEYQARTDNWGAKPFALVPDVCAEVVSPIMTHTAIDEKARRYVALGVGAVLFLDPIHRDILVYQGERVTHLCKTEIFQLPDILPHFTLPVGTLYEEDNVYENRRVL